MPITQKDTITPPSGTTHQLIFHLNPPNGPYKFKVLEINYYKDLNDYMGGGQLTLFLDHEIYKKFKINTLFELKWAWTGTQPVKIMNGYISNLKRNGSKLEIEFKDKGALLEKKNYLKYKNVRRSQIISDIIRKAGLKPVLNWAGTAADDITSYPDDVAEEKPKEKKKKAKKEKKKNKKENKKKPPKVKQPKITHTNIQRDNTTEHADGKSYSTMLKEVIDSSNIDLLVKVHLDTVHVTQINTAPSNSPIYIDDQLNVLKNSVSITDPNSEMINTITVYYKTESSVNHVTQKNMDAVKKYGEKKEIIDKFNLKSGKEAISHANKILHQSNRENGLQIELSIIAHPLFNIGEWCPINLHKYHMTNIKLMITRLNFKLSSDKSPVIDICLNDYHPIHLHSSAIQSDPIKLNYTNPRSLGKSLGTPQAIRQWIDNNIKYQFYYDKRRSPTKVLKDKRANCYDQADLAVEMMKGAGYHAYRVCGIKCGRYGHCNGKVKVNGKIITFDTTCSRLNRL